MNKAEKIYQQTLKKIESGKRVPALRIIRLRCLDCCCWQEGEVRLCPARSCISWHYRMGKNPVPKKLSEEQIAKMKANLARARKKQR